MLQVGSYMRRGSPILLTRLIVGCPTGLVDERGEQEVRAFRAPGRLLYETSIDALPAILFRLAMKAAVMLTGSCALRSRSSLWSARSALI